MNKHYIKLNSDIEHVNRIHNALKNNDGYCPCALIKTDDTKCMCKDFRENTNSGRCKCGLYEKVSIDIDSDEYCV